jgi:hypothetical protein
VFHFFCRLVEVFCYLFEHRSVCIPRHVFGQPAASFGLVSEMVWIVFHR